MTLAAIDAAHLTRQHAFNVRAFGPVARPLGILDHARKEIDEIAQDPTDLGEWVDLGILAFHGALNGGHTPQEIIDAFHAKLAVNEARVWPDWRTADPDKAIEHDRTGDVGVTAESTPGHSCDNCDGVDPDSCFFSPPRTPATDSERVERLRFLRERTEDENEEFGSGEVYWLLTEVTRLTALLAEQTATIERVRALADQADQAFAEDDRPDVRGLVTTGNLRAALGSQRTEGQG